MNATEAFDEFRARRDRERAVQDATHISWRKATLPGSAPSDPAGYVARNGDVRAYVRPIVERNGVPNPPHGGRYEYGRLVVDDVVPILTIVGTKTSLHDAKTAAFELVRETIENEKEESMSPTAEKTSPSRSTGVDPSELRTKLVDALREAIPDAEIEMNKTNRYETYKVAGKAIGLVFVPGARSVQVKIEKAFRDVRVPAAAGLKKSNYGLMGSVKDAKAATIAAVVKAFAAAAEAARESTKPAEEGGES